jgi:hypothetical protein
MNLYNIALNYASNNISVIPVDVIAKSPLIKAWKKYQYKIAIPEELYNIFFGLNGTTGIATICGKVSGNLEFIDIDNKIDDIDGLYAKFKALVDEHDSTLWNRLLIEKTQSGGYHIGYRCTTAVSGNKKLSQVINEHGEVVTIVETRGEGGYVVVAPSTGYNLIQRDFSSLEVISTEDRNFLLNTGKCFNKMEDALETAKNIESGYDEEIMPERPGDAFNKNGDIIDLLIENGWTTSNRNAQVIYLKRPGKNKGLSATFNHVPNKLYIFSTNAHPFEGGRTYDKFAVYSILKHNGDFKVASRTLLKEGYGKASNYRTLNNHSSVDIAIDDEPYDDQHKFWEEKFDAKGNPKLTITKRDLLSFLHNYGFGKYSIDGKVNMFVRVDKHIVTQEDEERIGDFIVDYIKKLPEVNISQNFNKHHLMELYLQQVEKYLSSKYLGSIDQLKLEFITDTKDTAFFFFKHFVVKVTQDDVSTLTYQSLSKNQCIWNDQIIDKNFTLLDEEIASNTSMSVFGRFLERVCSPININDPSNRNAREIDEERLSSLVSALGYLQHTFQNPAVTKAVVFCEEKIARDDESNGRTGKGLTSKALDLTRKRVLFNGKQLDFKDKFLFQKLTLDTQLICFDDVRKNFDFENLFSMLTEGLTIERKGQKAFDIPFKKSPKILITTNNVLSNDADSHRARKHEIEFSDYFTADYTPLDEFKDLFFEWEDGDPEWDRFFSFMIYTVKHYMANGLIRYTQKNLAERKLLAKVPEEFLDYIVDVAEDLKNGEKVYKDSLYDDFTNKFKIFGSNGKRAITQKMTTKWFNEYLKFREVNYIEDRNTSREDKRQFFKFNDVPDNYLEH